MARLARVMISGDTIHIYLLQLSRRVIIVEGWHG
jgi:hypothetical protein